MSALASGSTLGLSRTRSRGPFRGLSAPWWILPTGLGVLGLAVTLSIRPDTDRSGLVSYDVAFAASVLGALIGLRRADSMLALGWHAGPVHKLWLGLRIPANSSLLAGAPQALAWPPESHPASLFAGMLHLAALASVVRLIPTRRGASGILFLAVLFAGPHALGDAGRLLLGVDRWFQPGAFPDLFGVFGPILVLLSLTCALHGLFESRRLRTDPH